MRIDPPKSEQNLYCLYNINKMSIDLKVEAKVVYIFPCEQKINSPTPYEYKNRQGTCPKVMHML